MATNSFDTDVAIVGSGFGGSVAALRFAEAGERVTVIERGDWVDRESFEVDLDALWNPKRHRFGMNDLRLRGRHIVPWLGAAVGGGSQVYAGTLKRADNFDRFPRPIADDDMDHYYDIAENMMAPEIFPAYPPYSQVRATQLLFDVGVKLKKEHPDLVEEVGPINLAISFAPEGGEPGAEFINKHGAKQRYSDPTEQGLLGGDIDSKNSLDRNYLFVAQKKGAKILPLCEVDKVEPLSDGGYRVHYTRFQKETTAWRLFARKWLFAKPREQPGSLTCKRLVFAAGCIGSTELLLRNRNVHKTLPKLSSALGTRYTTNGDFISLIFPFRGLFISWIGFFAVLFGLIWDPWWIAAAGAAVYFAGLLISRRPFDPDIGATNSDYIRFRDQDGNSQGAYIESGRYPTPVRLVIAIALSSLGLWKPRRYGKIIRITNFLRRFVPPFAMIARTWPIPLLKMGRDKSLGTMALDKNQRAVIDINVKENANFYKYLNRLGKLVAKAAGAWWAPNILFKLTKHLEVPHNQGGAPMGASASDGVVDHAGRVFGHDNLMVLDGSIMPVSPGPNPALTILALSERAMAVVRKQIDSGEVVRAEKN